MSAPGWIKVHRALLDHWCATEPEALAVWVRLLCEANFEGKKANIGGRLIDVKRGQLVFGLNAFSERSGVSVKVLRRIISQLESDGMLGKQNFNKFSLITITCYDEYQEDGKQKASEGQAEGNRRATPKEVNNSRSKEGKKDKQDPAGADIDFSPLRMTTEQVEEVKRIRRKNKGGAITQRVANALSVEFGLARAMGYTSDEVLTEWELRGWKSLKAEWMTPKHGFKNLQPAKKPKDFGT